MAIGKKERLDAQFETDLLRKMLLIRRFEEKAAQMYGLKKIGGFCHLYIGQEAAAVILMIWDSSSVTGFCIRSFWQSSLRRCCQSAGSGVDR